MDRGELRDTVERAESIALELMGHNAPRLRRKATKLALAAIRVFHAMWDTPENLKKARPEIERMTKQLNSLNRAMKVFIGEQS